MTEHSPDPVIEEQKALTAQHDAGIIALGKRKEVRELVQRLKLMAPGGLKLTDNEALALAQYSYSMGLNPLRGEAWFMKDKDGNPLGMMVGIAGFRRKAQEQCEERNDAYWLEFDEFTDPDERAAYLIPEGALAFKCRLYEKSKVDAYTISVERLAKANAPWDEIKDILGKRPCVVGISYVKKEEMDRLSRGKLQMPHVQRAQKRAEAHALKQAFHIPFGFHAHEQSHGGIVTLDEYVYDTEWTESDLEESVEKKEEERGDDKNKSDLLFSDEGTEDGIRRNTYMWKEKHMGLIMELFPKEDQHPGFLSAVLNLSPFRPNSKHADIQEWCKLFATARLELAMEVGSAQKWADDMQEEKKESA